MPHFTPTTKTGNVGILFRAKVLTFDLVLKKLVEVPLDTFTTLEFTFIRPDGTKFTRAGVLTTDGLDGLFEYRTVAGDLDVAGSADKPWQIEGHAVLSGGDDWKTGIGKFIVELAA